MSAIEGGKLSPDEQARGVDSAIGKIPTFEEKLVSALVALRSKLGTPVAPESPLS